VACNLSRSASLRFTLDFMVMHVHFSPRLKPSKVFHSVMGPMQRSAQLNFVSSDQLAHAEYQCDDETYKYIKLSL